MKHFTLYSITTKKDEERQKRDDMPSLFEIVLDPSVLLEKTTQEPTIFDIVLRPEKFIYDSSEEVSLEEEVEFQTSDVEDYNRFKYEFTTESREEIIPAATGNISTSSSSNSATSNYTYYPAIPGYDYYTTKHSY